MPAAVADRGAKPLPSPFVPSPIPGSDLLEGGAGVRRQARALYWMGWRISAIAEHLGVARTTLHDWAKTDKWADAKPIDRVEGALESRMVTLIMKDAKSGGDFKELDLLGRQIERLARVHKYAETGKEADLNPEIRKRNEGPKRRPERNHFTSEQVDQINQAFLDSLFDYQRTWWDAAMQRTRAILKSRQIGATWYFAREALLDALKTGRNQIFLSASKAQSHIFKQYIVAFANEACGVDLAGDPIILSNGAHLYFLGTNARTAQGYHGNFYFDEFFWTHRFEELNKVASGMAMHKKWRKTYFSTPSSLQHQAYAFWSGDRINRKRAKKDRIEIDISHGRLASGFTGEDKVWRQIVNIIDAGRGGCDLFDLDELRFEYSSEEFENLLMCGFIDDSFSLFPLAELQACHVDSWEAWTDFKPFAQRPFGYKGVWVGYDPSHTGDAAGLVVLAPPAQPGGKFRVLHREQFKGADFEAQAEAIRKVCDRYNVQHMAIDTTGLGQGVYQLVKQFYPSAKGINYSVESKTRLVLKAQSVIRGKRLEFDAADVDLQRSFMAIKKTLTASGRATTFASGRSEEAGHSDLAWACMNALDNEPLEGLTQASRTILEIN